MGLFDKVEKTRKDFMLVVYVRHYGEISATYIESPTMDRFVRNKDAPKVMRTICGPIASYTDAFARDIGTGVIWDAKDMLFYLPPAWYDVRKHLKRNDKNILPNDKIDGKSIQGVFKKYIIEHVKEKLLPGTSLTETQKKRFLDDCGGHDLKEVFAKRFMGYPCEQTKSIYFFALFPNIRDAALPDK